jgi:hypothetical protein
MLILMIALSLALTPTALADDVEPAEEIWTCTCSAECDGDSISVSIDVCADDEAVSDAVDEGVERCDANLDGKCEDHSACQCRCTPTGEPC